MAPPTVGEVGVGEVEDVVAAAEGGVGEAAVAAVGVAVVEVKVVEEGGVLQS